MKNVKIVIATHKKYKMPQDSVYLPVHVGAEGKKDSDGNPLDLGYVKDNTGDNISNKNSSFCELTALYWAWKNLDSEYIGLAHYRRHFSVSRKSKDPFDNILKENEIEDILKNNSVIVPRKRKYYIETLYSHYSHTHYSQHLDVTREIIDEKFHDYLSSYDKVINRTYGFMFNMMILRKDLLDLYCTWLFDILFELEKRIDQPELSSFQGRFYGRGVRRLYSEIKGGCWVPGLNPLA